MNLLRTRRRAAPLEASLCLCLGASLCVALGAMAQQAPDPSPSPAEPSRQEIQAFFESQRANSARSQAWARQYQGRVIHWEGVVYHLRRQTRSHRVEILVRALPQSFLYDTIVALEGDAEALRLDPRIRPGARIRFSGKLAHGLDIWGVKQVTVVAPTPEAIRWEGPS
ncbi:MAG: hypothetical protein IPK79_03105 [Vampirovibrionales bacterium]|nr:hypothetical protein [Vampirovibrionales bacterium]